MKMKNQWKRSNGSKVIGLQTSLKDSPLIVAPREPEYITYGDAQARLYVSQRPVTEWVVECGFLAPTSIDENPNAGFTYSIPLHAVLDASFVLCEAKRWASHLEELIRPETFRRRH